MACVRQPVPGSKSLAFDSPKCHWLYSTSVEPESYFECWNLQASELDLAGIGLLDALLHDWNSSSPSSLVLYAQVPHDRFNRGSCSCRSARSSCSVALSVAMKAVFIGLTCSPNSISLLRRSLWAATASLAACRGVALAVSTPTSFMQLER